MPDAQELRLTQRQELILARVVEEYVATGSPVGSKTLVQRTGLDVSSSTVRYELVVLEEQGLLMHPHTSAGRVPTDAGYRFFVDRLLDRGADPNGRWDHWDARVTPLHLAALGGHAEVVRMLLAAGADPGIRDSKHDGDAAGWAEHGAAGNWREIIEMLRG